jgi:hypothetical protein
MIISHKHRFIFIKTLKTAGTSIEIALSKFCGPDDVITPFEHEDELKRKQLGYRGPQNYKIPFRQYSLRDMAKAIYHGKRLAFHRHDRASVIRQYIEPEIWDSYFKFAFERNPWDKVISWYYWFYKNKPRPPISEFIQSGLANTVSGFDLYTSDSLSEIIVDRVFKFEHLQESMNELSDILNLDETPQLPRAKGTYRKDNRDYHKILSQQDRDKIANVFAREIAHFNYQY